MAGLNGSKMHDGPQSDPPECIGTCMVCDPKCPVHKFRAGDWGRKERDNLEGTK